MMRKGSRSRRWPRISWESAIALLALFGIAAHIVLRFGTGLSPAAANLPLFAVLVVGGLPLIVVLLGNVIRREFGADLLAGISIAVAAALDEYLAGALVVLMLSGGQALERYAVRSASSVLAALAKRMPNIAHRKTDHHMADVPLDDVKVGDMLVVLPHETCPADGTVVEGHGVMDEMYLTGEPYLISKTPGAAVISGAINGDAALTIRADKLPVDSRYAKIVHVMRAAEDNRPRMRRLADRLGAWYTPVAVAIAAAAWMASGDPIRFLAVLVIATPCPLLLAIPVAIIGSISLAAKRSIIIRDPSVLELADQCKTLIFDKTGTLTYGQPALTAQHVAAGYEAGEILRMAASIERYSKHPLARAIIAAAEAQGIVLAEASQVAEPQGQGLTAMLEGRAVRITKRSSVLEITPDAPLPPPTPGLECVILVDEQYAATYQFRDAPRSDSKPFIDHLGRKHGVTKIMLVSGDRASEVSYLAEQVGIEEVHAGVSPEDKVAIVKRESATAKTLFLGDGINDAPALMTATVGVAFGQNSDITTEAAGAVILTTSLERVDEFIHISRRMRRVALQSAIGGMALSVVGMGFASFGYLPPVAGAIAQEVIDVVVILNALRAAWPPKTLIDY